VMTLLAGGMGTVVKTQNFFVAAWGPVEGCFGSGIVHFQHNSDLLLWLADRLNDDNDFEEHVFLMFQAEAPATLDGFAVTEFIKEHYKEYLQPVTG